jgi:hypothetical protein
MAVFSPLSPFPLFANRFVDRQTISLAVGEFPLAGVPRRRGPGGPGESGTDRDFPRHPFAQEVRAVPLPYEKQVIIQVLTGTGDDTVKRTASALQNKWINKERGRTTSHIVTVKTQDVVNGAKYQPTEHVLTFLKVRFAEVHRTCKKDWRLYITGHGNWEMHTCGGISGTHMAHLLSDAKLGEVKVISVTACRGAWAARRRTGCSIVAWTSLYRVSPASSIASSGQTTKSRPRFTAASAGW